MIHPEIELATSDMLIQFAKRSLGIANVVRDFAQEEIEKGELFQIIFNKKIPARQFCIVSDDRVPLTAAAEKLLELLQHK